jgi:hypothetical protein
MASRQPSGSGPPGARAATGDGFGARHFREVEGLSIASIEERLGRSPATIKAYFYDPTGEKAPAVKARYVSVCGCSAYTQPRNGKGAAYRWIRQRMVAAMREWRGRYGRLPPRMTGRGRTHLGVAARRSSGSRTAIGHRRAW